MIPPKPAVCFRTLPDWGPTDLVRAVPKGPVALLDGLLQVGQSCALVVWGKAAHTSGAPATAASIDEAEELAATLTLPEGAPALLAAAVGSLAWDGTVRFWLPESAVLFDYCDGRMWVRGNLPEVISRWAEAEEAGGPAGLPPASRAGRPPLTRAKPLWSKEGFCTAVRIAQLNMARGGIAKVILSVPFEVPCNEAPLAIYERLTAGSPPGLRFLLDDGPGERALVGVSPEPLVSLAGRRAELHLLAGTRRDEPGREEELLASHKDRTEHAVAVEQARSDLQQVCEPWSVTVDQFMSIERHPGLIHLASHLSGSLRPDASAADLVAACFPAGTVGGVPRDPARSLIDDLEPLSRDWYAGAVGAVLPGGELQLWLTIRTLALADGVGRAQTGAGLVPESDPAGEWQECVSKASRLLAAMGAEVVESES